MMRGGFQRHSRAEQPRGAAGPAVVPHAGHLPQRRDRDAAGFFGGQQRGFFVLLVFPGTYIHVIHVIHIQYLFVRPYSSTAVRKLYDMYVCTELFILRSI